MTTAEYWRDRAEMVMEKGMAKADVVLRDLQKMYAQAARDVQAEIDKLYRMYAQESGLSYADAQAYLNRAERTEWRMTLAEYADRINATGDKALLAELNALAAQSRVRRFRQVLTAIDVAASELRSGGEKLTEKLLRGTYRSAYRMAGDLLAGGTLEALNPASVAQALAYPWSGASFSDRIWSNAEQLAQTLRCTVTQGLIQGQDVRQMAAGVQKATGAAMHQAETLIRTETARCIEDGTLAGYKAAGVERYQILVSPNSRTCDACARLDGAVFRVDEAVTGVNYPPFHPNCRDTTVPYFGDEELARWEQLGAGMGDGEEDTEQEISPDITWFRGTYGETVANEMQALLQAADEDVVHAWNAVAADFRTKSPGYAGRQAYYSPMDDAVTINMRASMAGNNYQKPHQLAFHEFGHPYVKHTTKIFSLRLMDFQAQAYPDARRKTRGACQLLRVGQSRSPVRPLCNRKRFSCLPPQSKMSWILYAISLRLSGYTSTRSISSSASSVVSASASKIALDASLRLSCRACSSFFCFACANTAA